MHQPQRQIEREFHSRNQLDSSVSRQTFVEVFEPFPPELEPFFLCFAMDALQV